MPGTAAKIVLGRGAATPRCGLAAANRRSEIKTKIKHHSIYLVTLPLSSHTCLRSMAFALGVLLEGIRDVYGSVT